MSAHLQTVSLGDYERAADKIGLLRGGRARLGAMLHLVSGVSRRTAGARAGCTRQAIDVASAKVLRYLRACPLCRRPW